MKITHKAMVALGAVAVTATGLAGTISTASAAAPTATHKNRPFQTAQQRGQRQAEHAAEKQALSNNDFVAYQAAIANRPRPAGAPELTQAVFDQLVQAHKLAQSGDKAGAQKILESLGMKPPQKMGHGPWLNNLTAAQKEALAKARELRKAGKNDEAKAVLDAAGLKSPQKGFGHIEQKK